jgi:pimeloyl-ACP methyl ester carboxylesterase
MQLLLVHGLGRTPFSFFGLAPALRKAGHHTQFFCYAPTFENFSGIVKRLATRLRKLLALGKPVALIGHSLGGLLLRQSLAEVPELKVHHLIMMGTPNQPPRMARHAWKWFLFRLLSGSCGRFLATPAQFLKLARPQFPCTVIAGTAGLYGRFSPFGIEANDGLVAVSETAIASGAEVVQLPVWHSTMMNSPLVKKHILDLLRT